MTDSNVYTQVSSPFWDTYTKGRASVPESFWARIFQYHAEHSGNFDSVCDLGSAFGIHSPKLADRFAHTILCDPGEANIDLARKVLSLPSAADKFDFHVCTAENSTLPDASLDMVFMANSLHWTDPEPALRNIARQLKPGGTFVAATFGLAYFEDAHIRDIFRRIIEHSFVRSCEGLESNASMNIARSKEMQDSGYDSVTLPLELFEGQVQRVKLNVHGKDKPFYMARFDQMPVSRLGSEEQIVEVADTDWNFEMDLQGMKDHWGSFPFINYDEEYIAKCWRDLDAAAPNGKYKGVWPASIVLATRRK